MIYPFGVLEFIDVSNASLDAYYTIFFLGKNENMTIRKGLIESVVPFRARPAI